MTAAVTGISSPEPPDPDPPDLTSAFTIPSTSLIHLVLCRLACDAELLIVKAASLRFQSGVRPVLVLSNSQSFISLLRRLALSFEDRQ
ncbi:hypothetical protein Bca52824_080875 [Brassica carinata]|uniref:Uncharacterized protein n=1 Tax=Brassica carinata TaxID=52824 RepID=A0A8X7TR14_BRACI|nr:hypothetical protein Bca52824_080875 [Brassica carinata]